MHDGRALLFRFLLLHGPFVFWMEQRDKQEEGNSSKKNIEDDSICHVCCLVARHQRTLLYFLLVLTEVPSKKRSNKGQSSAKDLPACR